MKKPSDKGVSTKQTTPLQPDAFRISHPTVWDYLTTGKWEDGSARETATLIVLIEFGELKLCLRDRAMKRSAWVSGPSFTAALASLEQQLASDAVEWRKWTGGYGGR